MRHAILVVGYGNDANVLQSTINHLDDPMIDFFVHWDLRFDLPRLQSKRSKIFLLKDRIPVYWGTYAQIKVEKLLLHSVEANPINYDYVHLISSNDIPLMSVDYFNTFFKKDIYLGFVPSKTVDSTRISYYYPVLSNYRSKLGQAILHGVIIINKLLRINRIDHGKYKLNINKGPNWFSMRSRLIPRILDFQEQKIFKHSYCADEIYLQTIFSQLKPDDSKMVNDNEMAARYIDWERGHPYIFKSSDVPELRKVVNTKYAFARKIIDPEVLIRTFHADRT